jgi:predicted dehydrogenase
VEADAVNLVTPPEVHHEQSLTAFRHGCHVICEKPLSEVLPESIAMVREAERAGLKLMVGHNFRYLACSQKLRQIIRERTYGTPGFANFNYIRNRNGNRKDLNKYPLMMKQPMLLEQSVHHVDLIRYCYDDEIIAVRADTWRPRWSTYEDDCCVSALFELKSGMRVNYLGTWTAGWNRFCFEWRTDCDGGVVLQRKQFSDLYAARMDPALALSGHRFKDGEEVEPLQEVPLEPCVAFVDDTRGLLTEFVDAITLGAPLITSGKDHLKTLGVTLACVESAESHQRVTMREFYKRQGIPEAWI